MGERRLERACGLAADREGDEQGVLHDLALCVAAAHAHYITGDSTSRLKARSTIRCTPSRS